MRRVVGLASDELATRERVFDGLTMKAVRRSLRALTVNVVDAYTAAATPQLSTTPSESNPTIPAGALGVVTTTWTQEVDEVLFPYLVQTFVDAAEDVYAAMPETTGVAPKITYDLAASYLRSASNRLKGIGDLVWADMREQLALGYEAGESINQLAARLRTVAKISEPRALTIARTEVVPAANFGSLMQLKAVGFTDEECRKEWLATEDGRTRPAHLEADGQLVGLNQPFVVGGDFLQVPGDPAGRAENVINCRCSVAYVFDEDGDDEDDDDGEPLVADAAFERKHPRQPDGRFGHKLSSLPSDIARSDYDRLVSVRAYGSDATEADEKWADALDWPDWVKKRAEGEGWLLTKHEWYRESLPGDLKNMPVGDLRERMTEHLRKTWADKPIAVRVYPEDLAAILKDGRFKTQFESGKAGREATYAPARRKDFEAALLGISHDSDPAKRPVYGYVSIDPERPWLDKQLNKFGPIAVMLKDSVRARTTATVGDSLNEEMSVWPSPVDAPSWVSANPEIVRNSIRRFPTSLDDGRGRDTSHPEFRANEYVEAQIGGGVSVEDIAEVVFMSEPSMNVTKQLAELGIPWRHISDDVLVADASFEAKHPRQSDGRFGTKSPFTILPEAERGRPGNKLYAPGMLGQYGGAGLMMRHVGADGVPRYMVVQRGPNNFKSKWLWQLPGGSRDENETAAQAAARETFEEIGFTQEQLDTLEPRGAHVVKLPVEGKDPWTYSSVVADAPAAFKPRIDYTELGAARWLTYDQLVEMRDRGRLIKPFAAQLEDIIAKFDALVVAGFLVTDVTTSQDHAGYYALMTASKGKWTAADEAKVKRDAEGKFTKKAGAKITQHVPLHINTAVIYKKGGHKPNEVIAEKAGTTATDGVAQRLIWHAGAKKFMLQAQADNGVDWISVESYSKKAAYDKFSKETGWTKPAKAESVVAIVPPAAKAAPSLKDIAAQQIADKTAATPIVVKEMKEVAPKLGKPIHINTTVIYKTKYADGAVVAEKIDATGETRLVWDAGKKKFVLQKIDGAMWVPQAEYNKGQAYTEFSKQTGWTHPVAKPPTPAKTTIPAKKPAELSAGEALFLVGESTSDELAAKYDQADLDALNEKLLDALDFGLTTEQEAEVLSDKITIALGQKASTINLPDLDSMTPVKALASILSMTPGDWQKLNPQQKAYVNDKIEELDSLGKISPTKYEKITGKVLSTVSPAKPASGVSLDQITKALTTNELLIWIDNIPVGDLGAYDQDDLENLKAKIGKLLIAGDIDYDAAIVAGDKIDQAMVPSIVEIPDFDDDAPSKIANFYDNLTQDDFDGLSASDQAQVAQNASFYDSIAPPGVSYSDKIENFVAGKGDADATTGKKINYALESAILMMTQSEYDALSKDEKIKLFDDAESLADPTGAINKKIESLIKTFIENKKAATGMPARTPTASPKVSFDWDDNSGPHGMTPIYYEGQLIGHAESSNNGSEAQLYDLNPVSPSSSYGQFVGVVNFDDGESIPNAVIDLVDSGMLSVPSASVGPGYTPNVVDDGSMGDFVDSFLLKDNLAQTGIINSMTSADVDKLTPSEYAGIAAQATWLHKIGFLSQKDFDEFNAKGTKTAVPNVINAPAPVAALAPVTGSKFFVDVHGKIKKINEISTPASPAPPPSMYKIKTPSGAAAMQQTMLSAAGKTWNGVQVSAIKKYGTSVGYRSINAVLRDDPKQLKLFNDSQLADAVKHAVNLQNAMTPLTDDVKLFRGTGAHAFGQNSISANFDELKKLQGSVVTDKGFLSTTVDENKGVSYDYAKKPIQVVFSAPVGTPALHVDSAIPGHSEHEVLLAAGTSYRIDEVRKATDADRVKYGNPNLEHVVEATIVPTPAGSSTPLSAPPAKPAAYVAPTTLTPGTSNAPVSATKAGPIKASDLQWPMKITTSVIHTMKYQHGAVVAYRKNPDGSLSRLVWSGTTKKFISQNQLPDGSWQTFAGYTKKDAYGTFGKAGYAGSWFSPPPGDSAIGSGGPFGTTSVAPKVSTSAPAPSTVTTAPAPAPVKQEKFDAAELQKLHGQIPAGMWPGKERELFDDFKKNSSVGFVSLSSPEASLFTALHETLVKNNDLAKVSSLIKPLNMLQLLKIIDEESTNKANAIAKSKGEAGDLINAQLYEKKLVAWLQTPSGATYATEILYPPPPAPYDPSGPVNANKTYKSPNFTPQIIDTLHKIKDPAQIGTPDPKVNVFAPISHSKALELQKTQLASDPWTTTQKNALTKYTGSYYTEMNPIIRDIVKETKYKSETALLTAARTAVNIQAGMRPLPESIKVFRKTNPEQFSAFGLNHTSKFADIKKIEGKLFIDQAPMSTSIDPNKWSGTVHFEIDLPKGTPAIYVDNISNHKGEMEMILALGLKYRIISVKEQYGTTKVHMRVEA